MNPRRLLQHFETISEAPDAVARLRRFILDLAVRGKLVEQDPNDEPSTELLKRIQVEKERLTPRRKDAKKSKEKANENLGDLVPWRESSFAIPDSWLWVRIREVTSDRGQAIPVKDFTYIDVTAINKEVGCIADAKVVSPTDAPSRARKLVCTGDVLYSFVRPYLLNIAIVEHDIEPAPIASTAFAVLNGFGLVLPRYQWIALRSQFMVECVEEKMRGQAYPAINDSDFAVLPFPLAPLAEQHRIVAKVDELMALCDHLQAARDAREQQRDRLVSASLHRLTSSKPDDTLDATEGAARLVDHAHFYLHTLSRLSARHEHISELRKSILDLAVTGRLVPQISSDPHFEITPGNFSRKSNAAVSVEDRPCVVPASWRWFRLGEIAETLTVIEERTTQIEANMCPRDFPSSTRGTSSQTVLCRLHRCTTSQGRSSIPFEAGKLSLATWSIACGVPLWGKQPLWLR